MRNERRVLSAEERKEFSCVKGMMKKAVGFAAMKEMFYEPAGASPGIAKQMATVVGYHLGHCRGYYSADVVHNTNILLHFLTPA